ncbi:N-acetylmuramoyl-L-alanine amidase [Mesobacillus foraminis]|uniref:N-acetylmuramoyl-L-alanine amidase n=1 Tax=Mesobacillus foraminis TaxID=279826 RepID=A0A4R2BET5_9BACI|nr:N-acetylmuramoyl-L-alanine amidase [Mesobacillus foraminis]TCN25471.1 N-acetylmuramoyl-L-alanine amidase CwlA [Mesobacillus foraminis]
MANWREDIIKVNPYSHPNFKLLSVKGIILHYTANPGATAKNHQKYFNNLKDRYASAHIFVDKDEAILILPLDKVAYHANDRSCKIEKFKATASYYKGGNANLTTIAVEMCIEKDGSIHPDTFNRTVKVVTDLCKKFKLDENDLYMHYQVTGKPCPLPWVNKPAEFNRFKSCVNNALKPAQKTSEGVSKAAVNTYKIKPGDTLWSIANDNGITVNELKALNKGKNLEPLQIGVVLNLKEQKAKTDAVGTVTVLVDELWYYNKPDWNAKEDTVDKGTVLTVVETLTVNGSKMYKLKSGTYITSNTKYVRFKSR